MRWRSVSVRTVAIGWALVACSLCQAENLGRIGPTYPIAEQNLLDHIMARLREKERSGELAKFEQLAVNELTGVERIYGIAAVDQALLLRSGRRLIKLSAAKNG